MTESERKEILEILIDYKNIIEYLRDIEKSKGKINLEYYLESEYQFKLNDVLNIVNNETLEK